MICATFVYYIKTYCLLILHSVGAALLILDW